MAKINTNSIQRPNVLEGHKKTVWRATCGSRAIGLHTPDLMYIKMIFGIYTRCHQIDFLKLGKFKCQKLLELHFTQLVPVGS